VTTENGSRNDEALARLADAVEARLADGETPDAAALAEEFEVSVEDAADVIASLTAVGDALFADIDAEPDLPVPALPEDYEIEEEIGRGGMGVVYRVRQRSLGRTVAVKVIRPGALGFGETVKRFKKEARSLARLRHPGIVSVHEVGLAGDAVYFTMDWVDGGNLADRLRDGALRPGEAVRILIQVTSAIAHTHERGIIHRDLKPANVLLDRDGNAWVVDFGLARDSVLSVDATGTGRILGTPAYMSPEQARGAETVGEATDVYALGALLYESLAGRAPFEGRPLADTIQAVLNEEPRTLRRIDPSIPKDLETIVMKAMAKRPEDRYATARALLEDLRAFSEGAPIRARRPGAIAAAGRLALRHRSPLFATFLTVAALGVAFFVYVLPRMGQTAETLAASADALRARGEIRAALTLYEQALAEMEADEARGDLATRVEKAQTACRGELARELVLAGEYETALADIDTAVREADAAMGRGFWPSGRLLFDRYLALAASGEDGEAKKAFRDLRDRLKDESRERNRGRHDWRAVGMLEDADAGILQFASETLDDPAPLGAIAAEGLLELARSQGGGVADLLLARGEAGYRTLLDMIRADGGRGRSGAYWTIRGLCQVLATRNRDGLLDALASLVADSRESADARACALNLLAQFADLPVATNRRGVAGDWDGFSKEIVKSTVETLEAVRKATPEEALRLRIDLGMKIPDAAWMKSHTDWGPHETDARNAWWAEQRERDPRFWLAPSVDLPADADPSDPETLLAHLRRVQNQKRFRVHLLLCLAAPEGVTPPYFLHDRQEPGRGLDHEWREALHAKRTDEPWLLRVAYLRLTDCDPPEILWEEVRPIAIGEPTEIRRVHEEIVPWSGTYTVPGLGVSTGPSPARTSLHVQGFLLDWRADGLRLEVGHVTQSRTSPGGGTTSGWGGSNRSVHAGMILTPDVMEGYSSSRGGSVRNPVLLAVAEPPGTEPRAWTVDDWRTKLASNLETLARNHADARENRRSLSGHIRHADPPSMWLHPMIAAKIGLPGRGDLFRAFQDPDEITFYERSTWLRARLMAGDASVLGATGLAKIAGDEDDTGAAPWWGRLFLATEDRSIRAFAAEVLAQAEIRDSIAARLEEAVETRGLTVPPALREKIGGAGGRMAMHVIKGGWWMYGLGLLFTLTALFGSIFLSVGSRTLAPAAWLVFAGLGFLALGIYRYGFDLAIDEVGLAVATIGASVLARRAAGRARFVVAAGFGVALLFTIAARIGIAPLTATALAGVATAAAVLSLPWLACGLTGVTGRRFPLFLLLYGLPALAMWGISLLVMLGVTDEVTISGDLVGWIIFLSTVMVVWAAILLIRATARGPSPSPSSTGTSSSG
jgi:predicted Ser/Thr protein kinase/tetratricopeptide (TPR) repeat protein